MYRLYLDEVGTDDIKHVADERHRYLSLTGVIMKVTDARDDLTPKFNWIKANVFDHDPDNPLIFHRSDIVQRKRAFGVLNDDRKRDLFDRAIFRSIENTPYKVITAFIDKLGMVNQPNWKNQHPYHYLMEIMVEKFTQYLERVDDEGDIMPEGRMGKKDQALQNAFESVLKNGTYFVGAARMAKRISSNTLKLRYKPNNIAGLQLCDLLAHPSDIHVRSLRGHKVQKGAFCERVCGVLVESKYDRSNYGTIRGYGYKMLP